jgi:Uma2 family endonuclease
MKAISQQEPGQEPLRMTVNTLSAPMVAVDEPLAETGQPAAAISDEMVLWRWSVENYHRMAESGILDEDAPVELLEGMLVEKMTKKPPHTAATLLTQKLLGQILPPGWHLAIQEPMTLTESEPEPDLAVVRGEIRHYLTHHPGPEDVALVVEVADTTLIRDRGAKKRIYATARIPIYWIVNLLERCVEVYSEPTSTPAHPDYRQRQLYFADDFVPVQIDGEVFGQLAVKELLP